MVTPPLAIYITGGIAQDGFGDLQQQRHLGKLLASKYPEYKIYVVPEFQSESQRTSFPSACLSPDGDYELISIVKGKKTALDSIMKTAKLVINLPYSISEAFKELGPEVPKVRIYEYSSSSGEALDTDPVDYFMGVDDSCLGIVVGKGESTSEELVPLDEICTALSNDSIPYFAYIKEKVFRNAFLYSIAHREKDNTEDQYVVLPMKKEDLKEYPIDFEFLKKCGFGAITFQDKEKGHQIVFDSANSKTLHIINPFPLNPEEFHSLVQQSNSLVGCTGDLSFSDMVGLARIPFYSIRKHKLAFIATVSKLALKYFGDESSLYKLLTALMNLREEFNDVLDERAGPLATFVDSDDTELNGEDIENLDKLAKQIALLASDPKLEEEAIQLRQILNERHNFDKKITKLVDSILKKSGEALGGGSEEPEGDSF